MKKIFLLAGEASGDLHGANLAKALKNKDSQLELYGFGGDRMAQEGVQIHKHYKEMAFMGFLEVIKNLGSIRRNFKDLYALLEAKMPDKIVLIDFPGFNLRVAKWAKSKGIEVIYYISPQVWAWKKKRVYTIKEVVDKMLCILPFEADFYQQYQYPVHYVGHPLIDEVKGVLPSLDLKERSKIALLPGSRKQEIFKMLPLMLRLSEQYPNREFLVVKAPGQDESFYHQFNFPAHVSLSLEGTAKVLAQSYAAIVTSGTATLETALYQVPQVVGYKSSWLSITIGRWLVNVKFISLVNLILDRELLKELIQGDFNVKSLKTEFDKVLNEAKRNEILRGYEELEQKLGGSGASARAADLVLSA